MTDTTTNGTEKPEKEDCLRKVFNLWNDQPLCQMVQKSFPAEYRENLDALLYEAFGAGAHATLKALDRMAIKVVEGMNPELDEAIKRHVASKPTIN